MPSPIEDQIEQFSQGLQGWQQVDNRVRETLEGLLTATDSRAIGFWKVEGNRLSLVEFVAKSDMPDEVREGFISATKQVSLEQSGLGIVRAVLDRGPTVAHVEVGETGLVDSASWLARFDAVQSLAVPIFAGKKVLGVLAVSTGHPFREQDELWNLLRGIAKQLGE